MASRKFEKGSEEWQLFMDFWKFCQDYAEPEDTDEWWENVVKQSDLVCKKHGNTIFIRNLIMSQISELERKDMIAHGRL